MLPAIDVRGGGDDRHRRDAARPTRRRRSPAPRTSAAPYTSAGGTLAINGTNITIGAGDDITAILAAINAPAAVAATGVTATAPGGLLTLTGADADTAIDLTGTTGSLITEFGIAVGPTNADQPADPGRRDRRADR